MRRSFRSISSAALLVTAPALAWTPQTQTRIVTIAARLAPPAAQGQLEKHVDELERGVLAPFQEGDPIYHFEHLDGDGRLPDAIVRSSREAIAALRQPRPFEEIVYRLGVVAHYVADASNPLNAADTDVAEPRYATDYLRYVESAQPRYTPVLYAEEPLVETEEDLLRLVARALHRSRQLYPLVGAEYRRIGFGRGVERFDDRSTAFGVGAVATNHAISDVVRVLRYIWLRGGGADHREELWTAEGIVVLPRRGLGR